MKKILFILIILFPVSLQGADDIRAYERADGGYDFFDFSGMLVYFSVPNEKGSYDFFDRTGGRIGWAENKGNNQLEFYDASGTLFRVVETSVSGNIAISSPLGKLYNLAAPNYMGGTINYDPKASITSFSLINQFIVIKPDDPE